MFSVSQLSIVVSSTITIALFIVAVVAVMGAATFTSIAVHSKRSKKNDKTKNSQKTVKAKKEKVKKAKETKVKTVQKTVQKTKSQTNQKQYTKKTVPTKTITLQEKPVINKSKLIGEEKVDIEDFKSDAKYKWAYSIKLTSKQKPTNNAELSWKSSDRTSILDALMQDTRFAEYSLTNSSLNHVEINLKYLNADGESKAYSKEYDVKNDYLSAKQFRNDKKELFFNLSIQQKDKEKQNTNNKQQDEEQVL